ncbi:MAG: PDZ domain-containing protein [Lysobacterales bacterium]
MRIRLLTALSLAVVAGCSTLPRESPAPPASAVPATPAIDYRSLPGRDPATVTRLRAAPPPAVPEIIDGRSPEGDRRQLAARGFIEIGRATFTRTGPDARDDALRQGIAIGADRIVFYAPAVRAQAAWTAGYFVRVKLVFGATFRTLTPAESRAARVAGGITIGLVVGDSPASRANLLQGDIVTAVDGQPVTDKEAFQTQLARHAGRPVTLRLVRNGVTLARMVRLGVSVSEPAPD